MMSFQIQFRRIILQFPKIFNQYIKSCGKFHKMMMMIKKESIMKGDAGENLMMLNLFKKNFEIV